jgi:hypothetical protein
MGFFPTQQTLTTEERQERDVLRAMHGEGISRGVELRERLRMPVNDFHAALQRLVARDWVAVSGNLEDPDEALRAYYNVRPSAAGLIRNLIG